MKVTRAETLTMDHSTKEVFERLADGQNSEAFSIDEWRHLELYSHALHDPHRENVIDCPVTRKIKPEDMQFLIASYIDAVNAIRKYKGMKPLTHAQVENVKTSAIKSNGQRLSWRKS